MNSFRFLVTGCAGFIGGHMVERLIADGHAVAGVDDFSTGKRENLAAAGDGFELIEGNLADPGIAARAVRGVTHVIHLASIPSVPRSLEKPRESMWSSVASTVALFEASVKAGVKRIVQASSSSIYGDNPSLPVPEMVIPAPLSPYAAAKVAQEAYGQAFFHSLGLDNVAVRYFNVFGPRQDPKSEYAAVIPKFVTMMLAGRRPGIFGDGGQSRDFTYVDNVVQGNLLAALHPEPLKGRAFNLACGMGINLNQLVAKINACLGTALIPEHLSPRLGEIRHSRADISLAGNELGYSPAVDFDTGLARVIEYFRGQIGV
ncbi:MAG: NAD-dependent epimerase/dehydratase family protein [Planctomycetes bacterium]|nr:NAD-dependent epimerase/dehydratase family protein [Planctomycetota bacterium]